MLQEYINDVKSRCGIIPEITAYDAEISGLLDDFEDVLTSSGVTETVINDESHRQQIITAATLYVKAHLGDDRSDTELYLRLCEKKIFRLTLEGDDGVE